jgi:hypothetical protein
MVKANYFLNWRIFLDLVCDDSNVSYFEKRVNTLIRKPLCRCAETRVAFPNFPRVVGESAKLTFFLVFEPLLLYF